MPCFVSEILSSEEETCAEYEMKGEATELPIIGLIIHTGRLLLLIFVFLHAIIGSLNTHWKLFHTHTHARQQQQPRLKKGKIKFECRKGQISCFITRNGKFISASHTLP